MEENEVTSCDELIEFEFSDNKIVKNGKLIVDWKSTGEKKEYYKEDVLIFQQAILEKKQRILNRLQQLDDALEEIDMMLPSIINKPKPIIGEL